MPIEPVFRRQFVRVAGAGVAGLSAMSVLPGAAVAAPR